MSMRKQCDVRGSCNEDWSENVNNQTIALRAGIFPHARNILNKH